MFQRLRNTLRQGLGAVRCHLAQLSYRTGLCCLGLCVLCYVLSFAQWLLPLSVGVKTALWVLLYGLAKALQYTAIAILGSAGWKRLRQWWRARRPTSKTPSP